MANPQHLAKLKEGVEAWDEWRKQNPGVRPDLKHANLRGEKLNGVDLSRANLSWAFFAGANLCGANFYDADLTWADLSKGVLAGARFGNADLTWADLREADLFQAQFDGADLTLAKLSKANLQMADLGEASLHMADLSGANLSNAHIEAVILIDTNLEGANLTGCYVYGVSVWNVNLKGAIQSNLVITQSDESPIQVDNLEVAQFIYLLLNNQKIRSIIDTITSKVVLILGRFTPERKAILDAIRDELRRRNYLPVLFDFEKPASQTTVETISTLAHMARFVIADLTDAKSVLQELQAVVPLCPSVPVRLLLLASQEEPGMLDFIHKFQSVLGTHRYTDQANLLKELKEAVIDPGEAKAEELARKWQR